MTHKDEGCAQATRKRKSAVKRQVDEQNTALAIIGVLRKVVTDIMTVHGDIHQALHRIEELDMKVSELSGKVDTLINVAMDIKAAAANAGQGGTQDDPQVQEIADRIDQAVDALRGLSGQVPGAGPISTPPDDALLGDATQVDPNAPVV